MKWVVIVTLGMISVGGLYILYLWLDAWAAAKTAPRSEMFLCDTHGPMRKEHMITFVGIPYCPLCFHSKLTRAEKIDK